MPNREQEEQHLAEANRHIAKAEAAIRFLQQRMELLRIEGTSTVETENLFATMWESLALMKLHREVIVDRLADLKNSS